MSGHSMEGDHMLVDQGATRADRTIEEEVEEFLETHPD